MYEFTVESTCGERSFLGRYHVVVEDGQVSSVEGLDERSARLMEQEEFRALAPTLSDLEEEVRQAREQGADVADITYDDERGHPASISIDWQVEATDDEACYEITDFDASG